MQKWLSRSIYLIKSHYSFFIENHYIEIVNLPDKQHLFGTAKCQLTNHHLQQAAKPARSSRHLVTPRISWPMQSTPHVQEHSTPTNSMTDSFIFAFFYHKKIKTILVVLKIISREWSENISGNKPAWGVFFGYFYAKKISLIITV